MVGGCCPKAASSAAAGDHVGPMQAQSEIGRRSGTALYHGWLVVAAAFLVAMFGFGLGFYGPGIYLVALHGRKPARSAAAAVAKN